MAEEQTADNATPKVPAPPTHYCRLCREWVDKEVCLTCGGPTVRFTQPIGAPMAIAGVWDPDDGDFHIVNFDDFRNLVATVEGMEEKLNLVLKVLQKGEG